MLCIMGWEVLPGLASPQHIWLLIDRGNEADVHYSVPAAVLLVSDKSTHWLKTKLVLVLPPFMFTLSKELEMPKEGEVDCFRFQPSSAAEISWRVRGSADPASADSAPLWEQEPAPSRAEQQQ